MQFSVGWAVCGGLNGLPESVRLVAVELIGESCQVGDLKSICELWLHVGKVLEYCWKWYRFGVYREIRNKFSGCIRVYVGVDDCSVRIHPSSGRGVEVYQWLELLLRRRDGQDNNTSPHFALRKGFQIETGDHTKVVGAAF